VRLLSGCQRKALRVSEAAIANEEFEIIVPGQHKIAFAEFFAQQRS
jgi:hypothetical protein